MIYLGDSTKDPSKLFKHHSVDAIISDPPYGIFGETLDKHYNRNESNVLSGYIDVKPEEYLDFSNKWIQQASIILKKDGFLVIVSGWSNLYDILYSLKKSNFKIIRHIIWKYNFGVYTKNKFITSHYHILIACKNDLKLTQSKNINKYESVWKIPREYHTGEIKNKNQLPSSLLQILIDFVSKENDLVVDLFMGGFSTLRVAKAMNRNIGGIELNKKAFIYGKKMLNKDIKLKPIIKLNKTIQYLQSDKHINIKYPSYKVKTAIYYFNTYIPSDFLIKLKEKMKENSSIFIVTSSKYLLSCLKVIKNNLEFKTINHIIWNHSPYKIGHMKETHHHILFLQYGKLHEFYREAFYKDSDRKDGLSMNYKHREDVWDIKMPLNEKKTMPKELILKMINYTTLDSKDVFLCY